MIVLCRFIRVLVQVPRSISLYRLVYWFRSIFALRPSVRRYHWSIHATRCNYARFPTRSCSLPTGCLSIVKQFDGHRAWHLASERIIFTLFVQLVSIFANVRDLQSVIDFSIQACVSCLCGGLSVVASPRRRCTFSFLRTAGLTREYLPRVIHIWVDSLLMQPASVSYSSLANMPWWYVCNEIVCVDTKRWLHFDASVVICMYCIMIASSTSLKDGTYFATDMRSSSPKSPSLLKLAAWEMFGSFRRLDIYLRLMLCTLFFEIITRLIERL